MLLVVSDQRQRFPPSAVKELEEESGVLQDSLAERPLAALPAALPAASYP